MPPPIAVPPPPQGTPEVPAQRPLSADEAARIALHLQPSILIARASLLAQKGLTRQARSALLPQVILSAGYTHLEALHNSTVPVGTVTLPTTTTTTGGTGTGGTTPTTTTATVTTLASNSIEAGTAAQATLQQLLFDFDHTRNLVRQSKALERAANQNLTRAQLDAVFLVKQAYYQYVQNLQLVHVNEEEVANRQEQLDLALSRYNVGLGEPVDVYSAQTAKAEAILDLNLARDNAEQARINLALLIGIDARTPIQPSDTGEPPIPTDDVNALVAQGLKQRPEILQAQETIKANQYGVSAAKTSNAPVLSGQANVFAHGDESFDEPDSFLTAGVNLTWNFIDGGLTRGRVETARAQVLSAQAQLLATQLTVKSDVTGAYVNLRSAEQRVAAAQADVTNAEENVHVAEGRYRTGIGQFVDIINAQAFLLTARTNLVTTLQAIPQYRATLAHALGTPVNP